MEELFENTVGEQTKRAVVAIGRMNPPTIGHYKLIDQMKAFIRKNKTLDLVATPIVVIIEGKETSKDKSKNPLSADDRKRFIEASGRADGVKILIASSGFAAFEEVRKAGYEPIVIAAGSDRVDNYLKLLDKYFKTADDKPIMHYSVPGLERDGDEEHNDGETAFDEIIKNIHDGKKLPISMISGSLARHAASKNDLEAFAYITGLQKPLAKRMLDKIVEAQGKK